MKSLTEIYYSSNTPGYVILSTVSILVTPADYIDVRLITFGNPPAGSFIGYIITY